MLKLDRGIRECSGREHKGSKVDFKDILNLSVYRKMNSIIKKLFNLIMIESVLYYCK